jgi:hypothetical protein
MTGNPVTAKHEKRPHANHLFAVSYVSFLGKAVTLIYEVIDRVKHKICTRHR